MFMNLKRIYFLNMFFLLFFVLSQFAFAGATDRIRGHAWSDKIGWISFNNCDIYNICTDIDYGVTIGVNNILQGYAWNDIVGWIKFGDNNPGSTGGVSRGHNLTVANFTNNSIKGFAKILSSGSNNVWNGEISFGDHDITRNFYNVIINNNALNGWAWNDLVGWIKLNTEYGGVFIEPFEFTFNVNVGGSENDKIYPYISLPDGESYPLIISDNLDPGEVTFNWLVNSSSSENVFCVASGGWAGNKNNGVGLISGVSETVTNISENTEFILTCTQGSNTITRKITVYVRGIPPYISSFTADSYDIESGTSTTLRWTTENMDYCTAGGYWSSGDISQNRRQVSGSMNSGNLVNILNFFTLNCTPSALDDYPDQVSANITIYVEKLIANFNTPNIVPIGSKIIISWNTENANSCRVVDNNNNGDILVGRSASGTTQARSEGHLYGFKQAISVAGWNSLGIHTWKSPVQTIAGKIYSIDIICTGGSYYLGGISQGTQSLRIPVRIKIGGKPSYQEI